MPSEALRDAYPPDSRARGRRILVLGCLALGLGFAAYEVWRTGARLSLDSLEVDPSRLAAASAIEIALLGWMVHLWHRIVRSFSAPPPTFAALLRIWRRSTIAKYLPGSIWSAAVTAEMAESSGASIVALPASFIVQGAFTLSAAAIVGGLSGRMPGGALVPIAAALGGVVLAHPRVLNTGMELVARRRRDAVPRWTASWSAGLTLLLLHVATWAAFGVAFALVASSFVASISPDYWLALAGINALAFVSGFLTFIAPAGLGVRESVLVFLLAPFVPALPTRIALAGAARLWLFATEASAMGISLALMSRGARRERSRLRSHAVVRHDAEHYDPGGNGDDGFEGLADSRVALGRIIEACRTATTSIAISQLAFDADCVALGADGKPTDALLDVVIAAARRNVAVRVLLNGGLLLDTTPALRRALADKGATDLVALRAIKAFPRMMHAKMIIIDETQAFLMGASFVNGYWDGAAHVADGDPHAPPGTGERPLHDVAVRVHGHPARRLSAWFETVWPDNDVSPHSVARSRVSGTVRAALTVPAWKNLGGRTEILEEYLDAIGAARETIYLESQYFSARPIARAVRAALDARPDLEVILMINQNPDITAYRAWQDARLREHELLGHPRLGAFAPWSSTPSRRAPGRLEVTQVFVHSKVAIIDDRWTTIGSANLDGASLHSYGDDFGSWLGRRTFGAFRNFDANVICDGTSCARARASIVDIRSALWTRHVGAPGAGASRPEEGWLAVWRAAADASVRALRAGRPMQNRVLPYVPTARPRAQLAALGIDVDRSGLDLRFDPGMTEVLLSPGWTKRLLPERFRRAS